MAINISNTLTASNIANTLLNSTTTSGASNEQVAARNLEVYKNIFFPAPESAADYYRIARAIDQGQSVTYRTALRQRYTIPANILMK